MSPKNRAREVALAVWNAGVDAVRAERLIDATVHLDIGSLSLADQSFSLADVNRICVVGAGKAAGYLATALVSKLRPIAKEHRLHGWVNVPANCVEPTDFVTLHAARPAGVNEPRPEGVAGTERIRDSVSSLEFQDLCICLLTGGGSALLPAPMPGISLDDKLVVTRFLSAAGANIQDLNRVRIALSSVKGGGLARACRAGRMVTLIISDVIGDPLDLIASGPTVDMQNSPTDALAILHQYAGERQAIPDAVWRFLDNRAGPKAAPTCQVTNRLLANNATAVEAAANEARRRGMAVELLPSESAETSAEDVGRTLAKIMAARTDGPAHCVIWGGEPIVHLAEEDQRGVGGRNQQLVLAALDQWRDTAAFPDRLCILSGGTDGEDGPTDAAGAALDANVLHQATNLNLTPAEFLARNDAYTFFDQTGGLIKTGPTHTNVCDIRVAVIVSGTAQNNFD